MAKKDSDIGVDIISNINRRKAIQLENEKKQKKKQSKKQGNKKNNKSKEDEGGGGNKIAKLVIFLIAILVIVGILIVVQNRHVLGIIFQREITDKDAIVVETTTSENILTNYQSEILVYSKGSITTYNKNGKKTWEYKFDEVFNPVITTNGKYLQVVNKDTGYIFVFESKYEVSRNKIDGNIKYTTISRDGKSIIHYSTPGQKSVVGIYDKKGNEVHKIKLSTENVVSMSLSDDLKYLAIFELNTNGISLTSNIQVVDLGKENVIRDIASKDNVVIYKMYFNGGNIVAVCDTGVYIYNAKTGNETKYEVVDKNVLNIDSDKGNIAYIEQGSSLKDKDKLVMLGSIGAKEKIVEMEDSPKYFKYRNALAYISFRKQILVYNKWGKLVKSYTSENVLTEPVIFNNGKSIAMLFSNKVIICNI